VGTAAQQRMGHYLGAGRPQAARRVAGLCFLIDMGLCLTMASVMMLTREEIGRIFSSSAAIIYMAAKLTPLVAAAYCLVGIFYSSMAVLNGQGRPVPVMIAFLIGAFAISPSLGYALTFTAIDCCDFGDGVLPLYGLWFGLIGGYAVTTLISGAAVLRSDWAYLAKRAQERSEAAPNSNAPRAGPAEDEACVNTTVSPVPAQAAAVVTVVGDGMSAPLVLHDAEATRSQEC